MSIISKMRKQTAIWWSRDAAPDKYGRYAYDAPIEVDCRWDDTSEEFLSATGEKMFSRALVYVDRDMEPGDMLKLGDLESDTLTDPRGVANAFLVRRVDKNPNLKATEFLRTVYLS